MPDCPVETQGIASRARRCISSRALDFVEILSQNNGIASCNSYSFTGKMRMDAVGGIKTNDRIGG